MCGAHAAVPFLRLFDVVIEFKETLGWRVIVTVNVYFTGPVAMTFAA